jgi:hypothetical protein
MTSARDMVIRPVTSTVGRRFIETHHYSEKNKSNSQMYLGAYLAGSLEGVLSLGPPNDRSKMLGLVEGSAWENMCELNRMVFTDRLPKNSESRALGFAMRLLRKHRPQVKWVVSFADATRCGDGTIYRASGFLLTDIRVSKNLAELPDGSVIHKIALVSQPTKPRPELGGRSFADVTGGRSDFAAYCRAAGATVVPGHQLRYIRFVDPTWAPRLAVPILPFTAIADAGAGMYRGQRRGSVGSDTPPVQGGEGGAAPTPRLQGAQDG